MHFFALITGLKSVLNKYFIIIYNILNNYLKFVILTK